MIKKIRGFSLIEVMVAIGISGVILAVVATLAMYSYFQFNNTKARLEAETAANRLEYLFKMYLTQAVNIQGSVGLTEATGMNYTLSGVSAPGIWFGASNSSQAWERMSDIAGDWITLGVFVRDMGAGMTSELRPAAIWFRKPTATTSGVVFFDNGANAAAMSPDYNDEFISGITRLAYQRQDLGDPTNPQLSSVRISFSLRYQLRHGPIAVNWCPTLDITAATPGCTVANANFREIQKNFEVVVRNNIRYPTGGLTGTPGEVRTLGRLYFFRVINPARWNL